MNCTECRELLIAYVEGLLDESQKQTVAEHLKSCPACQKEARELTGLQERLVQNGKAVAQSNLENNVMNQIVREQNVRLKAAAKATEALKIRRTIMKSPMTKIAALAAVIVIAAAILLNPFGGGVTFADVVKPILNAKTIICDLIVGGDESGPVMHETIVGSQIRRTMSNIPNMTMVIDMDSAKMLVLNSEDMTASYVDIQGKLGDMTQSYVKFLRDIITRMMNDPNIQNLGEQIIDGRKAIGFTGRGPNSEVTIWADAKTALPIRIDLRVGRMHSILKNFELDVPVDPSLLSMDVPAGYTMEKAQFDLGNATEQDFIESLRIWAKILGDGTFPDAIGSENAMKEMPTLGQKIGALNLPEDQATQMGVAFGRGMLFNQIIDAQGDDWEYVGAGVKFGDADKPVFWYQPQGSATYRV
ncbi:MAG: zf-HC2 domain-containing protein, partial [Sedimentisphaerales bacterium]